MSTIVDLDTGQVLGVVDGRNHKGVGEWLFKRSLEWRLGVQVVAVDPVRANRRLLLRAGETLSDRGRDRLRKVFDLDDPTGKLQTAWNVKDQLRALLRTGSLQDAAAAKDRLGVLVKPAAQPETTRLWRTVCRWWKEIEVLIVTGATTAKVEANNTAIQHLKRTGRGFVNSRNYTTRIMLRSAARTAV